MGGDVGQGGGRKGEGVQDGHITNFIAVELEITIRSLGTTLRCGIICNTLLRIRVSLTRHVLPE